DARRKTFADLPDLTKGQEVVHSVDRPIKASGHIRILHGSLAPEGAVAKITGKEGLKFTGPAKVYDSEELMLAALEQHQIAKGDMTGPYSAQLVLRDPTVEVAILETARGGILRAGLGFTECDIGVVLNITSDHLGLGDIDTLDDMARVKAVLVEAVHEKGYAVLNADDRLVAEMARNVKATVAYFSMDPSNPVVQHHIASGGTAAVYEEGYISILKRGWKLRIEKVTNIPLTLSGKASFMIQNALAATLATFLHGVSIDDIRVALGTFTSSVAQTPGRLNLFEVGSFQVLVDYAHNAAGYEAILTTLERWDCREKIGVIGGPGDRRDQDLRELGILGARMFDRAIVKEDDDRRGRESGEVAQIIKGAGRLNMAATCRSSWQRLAPSKPPFLKLSRGIWW
ncbi:MAG: hypothetical protein HC818_06800, partial [Synechococcaceae cyanobacterium RM1_1_27]|nr:hypothetical protein [Synechococcaceae cyanobacterium RM1_1_27]